jgi:hypothetical protein
VVVWQTASLRQIKPHQESGFVVLVVAGLAIWLTLWILLSAAARRLLRHKDLLIPLGLYIPAAALLTALAAIPALAAVLVPAWPVKLFTITIALSLAFLIQLLLGVLYAGWTTALIIQAVRQDLVDPVEAFFNMGRWFLRVLGAEFIGWAVLLACVVVAIGLGTASTGLALVLIGACSLAWNLATAALLPVAVAERGSFRAALGKGLRVSWRRMGRWWLLIFVQMILLGWVTFIHVSYSTSSTSPGRATLTTHTKTNWQVNGFWTGGYEDTCRWDAELMKAFEAEPLPLVTTLLGLLFALLAILVKLQIVAGIYEPTPIDRDQSGSAGSSTEGPCQTVTGEVT